MMTQEILKEIELYDPPPFRPGKTVLETTVKVDGASVAVAYVALATETWEALPPQKKLSLMEAVQATTVEAVVSAETCIFEGYDGIEEA